MGFEMRCRRCGRLYTPTHDEIVAGPEVYRLCGDCRPLTDSPPRPIRPAVAEHLGEVA